MELLYKCEPNPNAISKNGFHNWHGTYKQKDRLAYILQLQYWDSNLEIDAEYTWITVNIIQVKNCLQFSLLTWNSFIGQFVHPAGG